METYVCYNCGCAILVTRSNGTDVDEPLTCGCGAEYDCVDEVDENVQYISKK